MVNILFVCTGNTCRSPMAAALMRRALDKRGRPDIMVTSAGLAAYRQPVSQNALAAITELDADLGAALSGHVSRSVNPEILKQADYIGVMSRNHASSCILLGADPEKITVLAGENGAGIPDPYGGSLETYRATRNALEKAVDAFADKIVKT